MTGVMDATVKVSLAEMIEILDARKGAMIVSMVTDTKPKLLAKSRATSEPTSERYPEGIGRLAFGRHMLATNYEANVQAQREREEHADPQEFKVEGLWKSKAHPEGAGRRFGRFLVIHVDKPGVFYFRTRPDSDEHGRPVKIRDRWMRKHDNSEVEGDELDDLKENYLSSKPNGQSKQQLAREIPYRACEVANVKSITIGGITYELDHDGETPEWTADPA